ncbi:thermonuclease family protein [Tianweitania sp. BSSL-BM11]|uniref:Thermonuclease family protein n=1 Tax=Tianweitania aestuarii TaxID=2814886 RepID=A0ABS5RT58_9HYPH|nr:thermonuclease family protein [Tianweitania aestuarii]MBS9720142.1 thermonuclease family protein [Tianweitania aestuarii]
MPIPSITDGDTIRIGRERIRIANIDAPELRKPQCDAERRLAAVAKARLAKLLASGKITLHRGDPQDGRLKDRHGRTLATITVDGRDVGDILVEEGLARPWSGRREPWCR